MDIKFTIPGEPKGKGRPRFSRGEKIVRTYTPKETANYENLVKLAYQSECGNVKFSDDSQIVMTINAYFDIPKSVSKKKRELMLSGTIKPTKKPDVDNIIKIIADSLNGIAYRDDSQIVGVVCNKFYSDKPCVDVSMGDL